MGHCPLANAITLRALVLSIRQVASTDHFGAQLFQQSRMGRCTVVSLKTKYALCNSESDNRRITASAFGPNAARAIKSSSSKSAGAMYHVVANQCPLTGRGNWQNDGLSFWVTVLAEQVGQVSFRVLHVKD